MYVRERLLDSIQLAVLDMSAVFLSMLMAAWLRHGCSVQSWRECVGFPLGAYLFPGTVVAACYVVLLRSHGLYSNRGGSRASEALGVLRAATLGTITALAFTFFYRETSYSRATVIIFYPLSIASIFLSRALYHAYKRAVLGHPAALRRILIVGFGRIGEHLGRELVEQPSYYDLRGFLDDDPRKAGAGFGTRRVVGTVQKLADIVRAEQIDEVIIAMPSASRGRVLDLFAECARLRVRCKVVPDLYDLVLDRLSVDQVGGLPLLGMRGSAIVGFNWALKRAFDVTGAALLLLLLSPLCAFIALTLRASSRGPALYRQTRIGLGGRPFTLLKFRSMHPSSDTRPHEEFAARWIQGTTGTGHATKRRGVHKMVADPRVTRLGRVLRRTSLDEIPQLWNVLRGEMSLVGPRPAIPYEVERYNEWHRQRLEVLPGLTGLWQVTGRSGLSFEEMIRLDIQYIETWSLEQDLKILLRTPSAVLLGKAY